MSSSAIIAWFSDIGLADRPTVGGKGGSLGELTRAGIPVPPGFVVRATAFEQFLAHLEAESPVRALVEALDPADLDAVTLCSKMLRTRVESGAMPDDLGAAILGSHAELVATAPHTPVAVRSSATSEDAEDASFAGLQDTYLWVKGAEATLHFIRHCWASLYSVPSMVYRRKHGIPESQVAMAVVVQRMVDALAAGVMFTRSPTTGDRSVVTVESSWGLGSAVVGGEVTPDRFVIGKITGEISSRTISEKWTEHLPDAAGGIRDVQVGEDRRRQPSISDERLLALVALAKRVEAHYGRPQDIEWAIDRHSGEILLLQSRPETVWSNRDAAPVARPAANPMDHVLALFGGKR